MNIIDALKKKHKQQTGQKHKGLGERKQFNMNIYPGTIHKIKRLAAEFAVPRYALTEHLLETGHFYVSRILKNRKKRDILREHLIDEHMLGTGHCSEEILRIGEGRYASEMISLGKNVVRDYRVLERVWRDAKKTGNTDNVDKARKKLVRSALFLADWLSSHPLEEPELKEMGGDYENSHKMTGFYSYT